ncbi:MAG: hypothetical protein V4689_09455 [Verrucomicrobiota bacterium]
MNTRTALIVMLFVGVLCCAFLRILNSSRQNQSLAALKKKSAVLVARRESPAGLMSSSGEMQSRAPAWSLKKKERDASEHEIIEDLSDAIRHVDADSFAAGQVENLTLQWAGKNLPAALNWAMQQHDGEMRDKLIGRVAFLQSRTAPAESARLVVEQIPPGPLQTEAIISVVHQWGLQNVAAATTWVESFPEGALKVRASWELQGLRQMRHVPF